MDVLPIGVFSGKGGCIWGSERISHFITPRPHRENITYCICPVLLTRDPRPSWVLKWCIQLCGCLYLCSSMTGSVVGERIAWRESVYHYICVCMGVLGACIRHIMVVNKRCFPGKYMYFFFRFYFLCSNINHQVQGWASCYGYCLGQLIAAFSFSLLLETHPLSLWAASNVNTRTENGVPPPQPCAKCF